jgi:hypothetical protein
MGCGKPGLAPAGELLSFASPKASSQRKGEPTVCVPQQSCGQPAVLVSGGVSLELGYRLKQSRALIPLKLRSSAQTEGHRTAQLPQLSPATRLAALRVTLPSAVGWRRSATVFNRRLSKPARAKQSAVGLPAVEAGLSSAAAGGSGLALFERSEFSQRVIGVRHQFRCDAVRRTRRASRMARRIWALTPKTRHRAATPPSARLFFGYLLLARQKKVTRPPGRDPAYPDSQRTGEN